MRAVFMIKQYTVEQVDMWWKMHRNCDASNAAFGSQAVTSPYRFYGTSIRFSGKLPEDKGVRRVKAVSTQGKEYVAHKSHNSFTSNAG